MSTIKFLRNLNNKIVQIARSCLKLYRETCLRCLNSVKFCRMAGAMESREFVNSFPDYSGQKLLDASDKVDADLMARLRSQVSRLLEILESGYSTAVDWKDNSVYTGTAGVALMYYQLYQTIDHGSNDRYLRQAGRYVDGALKTLRGRSVSFLCGDSGPLAVGAVVYQALGQTQLSQDCIARLSSQCEDVLSDANIPDELLFGRTGFLFALLFVRQHLGQTAVNQTLLLRVYKRILASGQEFCKREPMGCPLMYEWHEKKYLGAAHGLVGIMYVLMLVGDTSLQADLTKLVKPTVDWLMTLKYPSGNYPSSLGSAGGDKLVHWCHGAPGWIHLFLLAYKMFSDAKYLDAARECGVVLWTRGLLRKGYGICHGVAGNAYGFLALYNITHDVKYLYYANKFAEWCFDYNKHGCRTPDRPYSLFEGLAGTIYFLSDLLDPQHAKFPAFQL